MSIFAICPNVFVPAGQSDIMALLADRTAVVTGASSGNGRAIARQFANAGADLVVADVRRDPREGGTPTDELIPQETGAEATFVHCDVTDLDDIADAVDAAEQFGGIDVLVNNAGILSDTAFADVTEDEYDQLMDVNVKGPFFGSQYAAEQMRASGTEGAIINISSTLGVRGSGQYVPYVASKGAVRLLTYALADELGPDGIRVNAIHPGTIETEMNRKDIELLGTEAEDQAKSAVPLRRLGVPEEIADAAVFLASDMASYVNGASLLVDGGEVNTT